MFEDNWEIVEIFLALDTQWQWSGPVRTGLNYTAADFLLRLYEVKDRRDVFDGLQVMERAALRAWVENGNSDRGSQV